MKLPNADQAVIPSDKITGYLLSLAHPDGRDKAIFFMAFGFSPDDPAQLEAASGIARGGKEHIKHLWCTLCDRR